MKFLLILLLTISAQAEYSTGERLAMNNLKVEANFLKSNIINCRKTILSSEKSIEFKERKLDDYKLKERYRTAIRKEVDKLELKIEAYEEKEEAYIKKYKKIASRYKAIKDRG